MKLSTYCRTIPAVALLVLAAPLAAGSVLAQSASAAEPPPNPVDRAVLDAAQLVYAMPAGDEYEFTPQERLEGFIGMNTFPGGPFGEFPQPASSTDPEMLPGSPGMGYWGQVSDLTGVNPRPAADESSEAARDLYGSDEPVAPACPEPESCDATALVSSAAAQR